VAQLSPYALRLALYLVLMLLFGRMLFVRPGLPRGVSLALALIAGAGLFYLEQFHWYDVRNEGRGTVTLARRLPMP